MKVPKHTIPARKDWRKIRNDAGGKSGMVKKANVGKALDNFHKAYTKAAKKEDPVALVKEVTALSIVVQLYITEVGKTSKPVATAAKSKLKKPIDKFASDLTSMSKAQDKELNKQVKMLDVALFGVEQTAKQLKKLNDKIVDPLGTFEEKYRRSMPDKDKPKVLKIAQKLQKQAVTLFEDAQDMQTDFERAMGAVDPAIRDSRSSKVKTAYDTIRNARNLSISTLGRANDMVDKAK